jgi:hypothetical protein
VHGEPEDQLRNPLETFIADVAELNGLLRAKLALVGESLLGELKTRPDFAVTYGNALIGYIEVKAPGKGADPRRFRERHDEQLSRPVDQDLYAAVSTGWPSGRSTSLPASKRAPARTSASGLGRLR